MEKKNDRLYKRKNAPFPLPLPLPLPFPLPFPFPAPLDSPFDSTVHDGNGAHTAASPEHFGRNANRPNGVSRNERS